MIAVGLTAGVQAQFYGALLFLCAGIMIHRSGTKQLARIRGVCRTKPLIRVAAAAGILAINGTPLFNGSISKYLIQGTLVWEPVQLGILLVNLGTSTARHCVIRPSRLGGCRQAVRGAIFHPCTAHSPL